MGRWDAGRLDDADDDDDGRPAGRWDDDDDDGWPAGQLVGPMAIWQAVAARSHKRTMKKGEGEGEAAHATRTRKALEPHPYFRIPDVS